MNQNDTQVLEEFERLRSLTPEDEATRRAIFRARDSLIQQPIPRYTYTGRIAMIARIAACITLVVAVGIIPLRGVWRSDGEGSLLASMIDNLKKSKNVSFRFKRKVRTGIDENKALFSESTYREWIDASGASRQETSEGIISIVNWKQRKVMLLNKKTKQANIVPIPENDTAENVYENLKNTDFQNFKKLPKKDIDGKLAIGLVAPSTNVQHTFGPGVTLWVDQETRLPIRIEGKFGRNKDDPDDQFVIDQIVFDDPKVVPSMFEIKAPDGYEVQGEPLLNFSGNLKDQ